MIQEQTKKLRVLFGWLRYFAILNPFSILKKELRLGDFEHPSKTKISTLYKCDPTHKGKRDHDCLQQEKKLSRKQK